MNNSYNKNNSVFIINNSIIIKEENFWKAERNNALSYSMNANLMSIGYILSEKALETISFFDKESQEEIFNKALEYAKFKKGANVKYNPFYPNFPRQVIEASDTELYLNAFVHYFSCGEWLPFYDKNRRKISFESCNFIQLEILDKEKATNLFLETVYSNESISEEYKQFVTWMALNYFGLDLPITKEIPFKENMCLIASLLLENNKEIDFLVKNITDILRIATFLSGGDISLAENTKFKSFPNKTRRALCSLVSKHASEEDVVRHKNKWIRLFHSLHIGSFSKDMYLFAKKIRNNEKVSTFSSKIESLIEKNGDLQEIMFLLKKRPTELARRLDLLLRKNVNNSTNILSCFFSVVNNVPTRVILQLISHFETRNIKKERIIFPKGMDKKSKIIPMPEEKIPQNIVDNIIVGLEKELERRFSSLPKMGNTWIDPRLKECPIPSQLRNASDGTVSMARGTKLYFGNKNFLRFFVYWIGRDIDLSASFHDENFELIETVSYKNLKNSKMQAFHSGDVTRARVGACEFIDVEIESSLANGARYVVMNVFVFSGPTFKEHELCYTGYMTRQSIQDNEIFDAKTVEQKISLSSSCKNSIPFVFDLEERKMIWCDVSIGGSLGLANNLENNTSNIKQVLEHIVKYNKVSLYKLFSIHAKARGVLVTDKSQENIETKFNLETIYNSSMINSEFLI